MLRFRRFVLCCLSILALCLVVSADPTVEKIPLAPHGDGSFNGGPLPLSPTVLVMGTLGVDNLNNTVDDEILVVTNLGGAPGVSSSAVGHLPTNGGRIARLSATRAIFQSSGADATWSTGDETLVLIDHAGSANVISQVPVGSLQQNQGGSHVPVRLTPSTVVLAVLGADNKHSTADDAMVLVTGLGTAPVVKVLPAPYLHISGRTEALALSPTSFLVASTGPDGKTATADDLLYLFTDVGGSNTRTAIAVPNLHYGRPGRPVRVSSTLAVVISEGPDEDSDTADDRFVILSGLGTTNDVTSFNLPYLSGYAASHPRVLTPDLIAVTTWGPDGLERTADDTIALISGPGTTNTVVQVTVGPMEEDRECRPTRLSPNRLAVVTFGPDGKFETDDDRLAILSDAGGTNIVTYVDVPGLTGWTCCQPIALSTTALILLSGGPDRMVFDGGLDNVYTLVTDLDTVPRKSDTLLAPGGSAESTSSQQASVPQLAGGGRAVALSPGRDGQFQSGGDDMIHVIEGLPRGRDVTVTNLRIRFKVARPEKGEKLAVKAILTLDDPTLFGMGDLTVSIGNAAETIPADLIVRKGAKFTYKAPKGGSGFIRKLKYDSVKGKLTISGKGVGTGAATTLSDYVPFTLDVDDTLFVGEVVAGTPRKSGIVYKAPK